MWASWDVIEMVQDGITAMYQFSGWLSFAAILLLVDVGVSQVAALLD